MSRTLLRWAGAGCTVFMLAACVTRKPAPPSPPPAPSKPAEVVCKAPAAGSPLTGTWFATYRPRGVAGDLRSLMVIGSNGAMQYSTQLKLGKRARPALNESGCWNFADGVYTMQTTRSAGELVDTSDPIYTNRYQVVKVDKTTLTLREMKPNGLTFTAKRMPDGYRLPSVF
jgi:hypothetical protein